MERWLKASWILVVVYAMLAMGDYQKRMSSYRADMIEWNHRLDNAEESRRQVAQRIQIMSGKSGGYEKDAEYIKADAVVDQELDRQPSDAELTRIKTQRLEYGEWGAVAYALLVVGLAVRRRLLK